MNSYSRGSDRTPTITHKASGSHFIEPLVGHRGVPEVILGAHHEISVDRSQE